MSVLNMKITLKITVIPQVCIEMPMLSPSDNYFENYFDPARIILSMFSQSDSNFENYFDPARIEMSMFSQLNLKSTRRPQKMGEASEAAAQAWKRDLNEK
jgi:hypothetical protein